MKRSNGLHKSLHWYIVALSICTFILIIAGGLVTSTQSGLSVPDWPNTYGHFMFAFPMDQMVGGIVFEHTHRMIASVVGFLTVVLTVWVWKRESRRWVRNLAVAALAAVIAQGVLGGLTVLFLLPTPLSVAHATLAQSYFAIIVLLALVTSRWWHATGSPDHRIGVKKPVTFLAFAAATAILIQLIIGAWMRHSDAGLAVPDFPLAYGKIIPSFDPVDLARYTSLLVQADIRTVADGPILPSQIIVHLLHRYWAIVVAILIVWLAIRLYSVTGPSGPLRKFSLILPILLLIQGTLGAFTVLSQKSVLITTAHVVIGAVLLVLTVFVTAVSMHLTGSRRPAALRVLKPDGVTA